MIGHSIVCIASAIGVLFCIALLHGSYVEKHRVAIEQRERQEAYEQSLADTAQAKAELIEIGVECHSTHAIIPRGFMGLFERRLASCDNVLYERGAFSTWRRME